MKNLLIVLALVSVFASCEQYEEQTQVATSFTLNGSVNNAEGQIVLLDNREKGEWINIDSSVVENGTFELTGTVDHPQLAYVKFINGDDIEYFSVFLENSSMALKGDFEDTETLELSGSSSDDLHSEFYDNLEKIYEPWDTLEALMAATTDEYKKDSIQKLLNAMEDEETNYTKAFITANTTSQVAPYLALRHLTYSSDYSELKPIYDAMKEGIPHSKYLDDLGLTLDKMKVLAVGNPAPEFTEVNVEGEDFQLSSLKGKYVLVDFWASWCKPCRKENPNVVAMYNEIGNENFEIIGVSLDKDRDKWVNAIADDNLTWYHVSDLKGWKSAVAEIYNVKAIPSTYLLDTEGNIVAKNLRGEELRLKIKELVGSAS